MQPLAFRLFFPLCALLGRFSTQVDFKAAFLQTEPAQLKGYVRPPKENGTLFLLWLLNVASYSLTNANAKWQNQSDNMLVDCNLTQVPYVPQLFYRFDDSDYLDALTIKLVDDVLIGGIEDVRAELVAKLRA